MAEPLAPGSEAPSRLRRLWDAPLWAHAAVLAFLLVVLVVVMTPQSAFTEDEGAYALQAKSLQHGSWEYKYKAGSIDPEGEWFPVELSVVNGAHYYPYVKHPAYPLLLGWAVALAGTTLGLHLLPLLGAVGAAMAAWILAGEVDASLRRPAFWMLAASPVLVNGTLLWAHAPSAALAGFALVGGARIVRRGLTPVDSAAVAVALVGGVLLRSEGLLFAGAVVGAVCLLRLRVGVFSAAAAGAVLGVPVAVAAVVERLWIKAIVGSAAGDLAVRGGSGGGSTSYVGQRLSGAFHSLLQGHDSTPAAGLAVLIALALTAGLAGTALRRWGPHSRRDLLIAGGAMAGLYVLRIALYPTEAVTGLFAAWPVAVLGLLLVRRRDRHPAIDLCLAVLAVFGAAVLLTEYPEGGGLEWGGRFFSPAAVPLAVLACAVLARRLREVPEAAARRAATLAVAGLVAAPAVFGLVTVALIRADQDRFIAAAARHPAEVTVTTVDAYPRLAWRTHDRLSWMLTDDAGLPELLGTLRRAGVRDVILVTRADVAPANLSAYDDVSRVDEPAFGEVGAAMLHLRAGG